MFSVGSCLSNLGMFKVNHIKKSTDHLDFDYIVDKDRKEKRKNSQNWRAMRKHKIRTKRFHDQFTESENDEINVDKSGKEGWDWSSPDGIGLGVSL